MTSPPPPAPRASSSLARCHAVDRPWTPAPMLAYRAWAWLLMGDLLLQVRGVLAVALGDGGVRPEERVLRHVRRVARRGRFLACRLGHGPHVVRRGTAAHAQVPDAEGQ